MNVKHLVKRAVGALMQTPPTEEDVVIVSGVLNGAEFSVWSKMQFRDQRHSIVVLRRFDAMLPVALREERAAALLHDVGKNVSGLGFVSRVTATVVGPRSRRFAEYHNHENLGAELLRSISDARTIELVGGTAVDNVSLLLKAADDI
jgi:hypothetical protein